MATARTDIGGRSIRSNAQDGKSDKSDKDYVMVDGDVVEFRTGLTSGGKK